MNALMAGSAVNRKIMLATKDGSEMGEKRKKTREFK
jgi:hypothetical protein